MGSSGLEVEEVRPRSPEAGVVRQRKHNIASLPASCNSCSKIIGPKSIRMLAERGLAQFLQEPCCRTRINHMGTIRQTINKLVARMSRIASNMPMGDVGVKPGLNEAMDIAQDCSQNWMSKTMPQSCSLMTNSKGVKAKVHAWR